MSDRARRLRNEAREVIEFAERFDGTLKAYWYGYAAALQRVGDAARSDEFYQSLKKSQAPAAEGTARARRGTTEMKQRKL